jgi:cobalamin biosynthesis protein CobT
MSSPSSGGGGGGGGGSSSSSPNPKKRTREAEEEEEEQQEAAPSPVPNKPPSTTTNTTTTSSAEEEVDLLTPLPTFDWRGFQQHCDSDISSISAEESALLDEYRGWEWLHELWTSARSESECVRLSRE